MAALLLTACSAPQREVEVTNPSEIDRSQESVEISWEEIGLRGLTPENVVVELAGEEIPSQVLFNGGETPCGLLFQCEVKGGESKTYIIKKGERAAYARKCFGRQVPERLDDYAWENDKGAYRAYGPALETAPGEMLATPGFDVWVKSVDTLVVDARYKRGNYHHNYGDGMDCYKVGRTLGGGASAPYLNDTLYLSRNYTSYETLEQGPIRTAVKLTYTPFRAGEKEVSLTKIITLDAGSHFNRIENIYAGEFELLPVAAGFVRHEVKAVAMENDWLGFVEAASDSKDPEQDGDLYFGVILPGAQFYSEAAGHAVAVVDVEPEVPMIYLAGSGWSQGGIDDMVEWIGLLEEGRASVTDPLQVTIL